MKKVAIVQSSSILGGRLSVVLSLIEVLNEHGVIPDLITARVPDEKAINKTYNRNVQFNIIKVFNPIVQPDLGTIPFHFRIRALLGTYDLIINTSNTNLLMRDDVPMISYMFFPRRRRTEVPFHSIHFPEVRLNKFHPIMLYKKLLRHIYKQETIGENTFVIAISEYVRSAILKDFDVSDDSMAVIYPPVDLNQFTRNSSKEERVITLGRFKSYKRQLQQMEIATHLPELKFNIVGLVSSHSYFQHCKRYKEEHRLSNVTLYPNVSFDELRNLLQGSKIFMFNTVNEPFGLTTVQAIAAGCVPVVHDSGGQCEIVLDKQLRFSTVEEAVTRLQNLQVASDLTSVCENLYENAVRNFSQTAFKSRMSEILAQYL